MTENTKLTPEVQAILIDEFVPIFQAHPNLHAAISTLIDAYNRLRQSSGEGCELSEGEREELAKIWHERGAQGNLRSVKALAAVAATAAAAQVIQKCSHFVPQSDELQGYIRALTDADAQAAFQSAIREAAKGLREALMPIADSWPTLKVIMQTHKYREGCSCGGCHAERLWTQAQQALAAHDAQFPTAQEGGEK